MAPSDGHVVADRDIEALAAAMTDRRSVLTDPDLMAGYARDRDPWADSGSPRAVVRAENEHDVVATLSWAARRGVAVVPRGAGSGLTGAANASTECVVLSLERMTRIHEISASDMVAVVEPGVITADLKVAASAQRLFYAPDPGSAEFSTIGGNIATNAGGMCCIKHGVTRESVLGIDVALADGRVVRLGGRTLKDVTGLDLKQLMIGSEGLLGVITKATLRLRPSPGNVITIVASFTELEHAGRAVETISSTLRPSLCELMDRATLLAVESFRAHGLEPDVAAVLILQSDGDQEDSAEVEGLVEACRSHGAGFVAVTDDPAEAEMMMSARRLAVPAMEAQGGWLLDDVCVPLSKVADMVLGCRTIGERHGVTVATFGHAGDGNLHPTIMFGRDDASAAGRAKLAHRDLLDMGRSLGGTVSGEHGIGLAKRRQMAAQVGPVHLELQRAIKAVFDPQGLLNPGKSLGPSDTPISEG